jgi:hypothetical protein
MKLSALALVLGVAFSSSAFATTEQWDSATPWGSATTSQYAEWNLFSYTSPTIKQDNTPDVALSASTTATLKENTGTSFITGSGNIYSFSAPTSFTATLSGSTTGVFDVYLRVAAFGVMPSLTATLNGVSATAVTQLSGTTDSSFGVVEEGEYYWKWSNITASSLYTFNFNASGSSMSLDQLALATVAVPTVTPVPEPEAYSLMALGLGLMAFATRRSAKKA